MTNTRRPWIGRGNSRVVAAPTVEPLSIAEAIAHLRENPDDIDSADLQQKITEARAIVEDFTGRALAPQLLEWSTHTFPGAGFVPHSCRWAGRDFVDSPWNELELPMPPALSIDSISYVNTDGDTVLMDPLEYRLDYVSEPAVLYLPFGGVWPTAQAERNSVRVRYFAGYDASGGSPDNNPLPPAILAAVKLMLGHLWENREAVAEDKKPLQEIPLGIERLLVRWQTRLPCA